MAQAGTNSPKVRRMLFHFSPFNFGYFRPTSTLLHGHLALATLSLPETDPQNLERWGYADEVHLGKYIRAKDFWSRILVWRATAFVNFTRRIGFRMSELFHKIDEDFGGSKSWNTQTNCRVFYESHTTGLTVLSYGSCFFNMAIALLVTILFTPFAWLFFNLAMRIRAFVPKSASILRRVEQTFWRMPFFTGWIGANSWEAILAGPSRQSTTGTLASGTSGSRRISLFLLHERSQRRIRLCHFSTLFFVTETAIVSYRTLPVGFPLRTISKNSLHTLFCSLILDHGVCLIITVSGLKIPNS